MASTAGDYTYTQTTDSTSGFGYDNATIGITTSSHTAAQFRGTVSPGFTIDPLPPDHRPLIAKLLAEITLEGDKERREEAIEEAERALDDWDFLEAVEASR